ncbi:peptidoglycan DD-metalloendopeptidase family protein [Candidatus Parcubacteria bacterium]|nr:peptidoglycan DD-metalloendopeptidase family protein [Candidatus Parcubacteria bacterium]
MSKIIKLIIPILFLGIIFNAPGFVLGQSNGTDNTEIKQLNQEIQAQKDKMEAIQKKQDIYQKAITQKQADKASLSNQLAILENRIAKAELDIETVEVDIDRTNLEIKKVNLEIKDKDEQIIKEKDHIGSVLRLMHKQDQKTALEIMLLNNSFSDFINQIKYLEDINKEIGESLDNLKEYKQQLEKQKIVLDDKKQKLNDLKKELEDKKTILLSEQENKFFILEQTQESEKEYQKLLRLAKQEQEQAAADIVSLEKTVRAKIDKMEGKKLEFNDTGLIWPVPKNVITAYFHDPDYPFRYLFEHPAIDIRAAQGTTLKAAASGYVARAKNAGKGYSYIMIVHGDGLATVYGHVSRIYVEEDEYVVQGQTIGLTGGLPGTPGAGRLTTGPHLHFEVRFNGIPVDPLEYMP